MVSPHEFPCPTTPARRDCDTRHSPVVVVVAVGSHRVGVGREERGKVGCCEDGGVEGPAYIERPANVCAPALTEPETLDNWQLG